MQNELQTALFQAFDTLNLQRVKTFSVPPVTLCGPGSVSSCGQQAQTRGLKHLFVMADSFLHQAGMTAGLTRSLAVGEDRHDALAMSGGRTVHYRRVCSRGAVA
ncbi:ethanolamine utilization protein EutG [Escherichia coli]